MFTIRMGIPPHRLADLSVIQIAEHVEYLIEGGQGGD